MSSALPAAAFIGASTSTTRETMSARTTACAHAPPTSPAPMIETVVTASPEYSRLLSGSGLATASPTTQLSKVIDVSLDRQDRTRDGRLAWDWSGDGASTARAGRQRGDYGHVGRASGIRREGFAR